MWLISLKYTNFKGLRDYLFEPNGQNADVKGDNGTFKTTLYDGFLWLLFGKDSQGKADFALKTLDKNNKAIPGLDHEVEGVFDIDGRRLTLKKVYREIWTQKRGSANKVFSGHEVNHFIDGVPCQKKEYDARIAQIAPEDIFKLLTSPSYFSEMPDSPKIPGWKKRRNILLEVCGDISDQDVIASDRKLSKLPDILQGRKLEDHKKVIAARKAEINKEKDKIPTRIDEANRAMPALPTRDAEELSLLVTSYTAKKEEKQQEQARIISGGEVAEKKRLLAEIDGELLRIQNEHSAGQSKALQEKYIFMSEAKGKISEAIAELSAAKMRMEAVAGEATAVDISMKRLRECWYLVDKEQFEYSPDTICPTCGQDLPEEQLAGAREKAQAAFNLDKAQRLEKINSEGLRLKGQRETLADENSELVTKANALETKIAEHEANVGSIQAEIDALKDQSKPITDNPAYTKKLKERDRIEKDIEKLNIGNEAALERVRNQITDLDIVMRELNDDLDKIHWRKDGQERIQELSEQEKALAAEFEKLEGELFLCDQFIKTKVAMMDEKINSKFKFARFKMFKENINGGIEPCCETLYGGVGYGTGLNNGARVVVGLDIIATLSDYYNFHPVIWIDNKESITKIPAMKSQVISLIVSEPDKSLRVVTEIKNEYREAV